MNPRGLRGAALALGMGACLPLLAQVKVAAGGYHTLAVGSDDQVWAWGLNDHGQLGDGSRQDRALPSPSRPPAGLPIRALAAGEGHSILLTKEGRVYACGQNDRGQLGNGGATDAPGWVEVKGIDRVIQVACGSKHTLALQADGSVWGWGDNRKSQLSGGGEAAIKTPRKLPLSGIRSIASGASHGLALTEAGQVWGWGDGGDGALGPGTRSATFPPRVLTFLPAVTQVAAGWGFTLALTREGSVLAWGRNDQGQLGDGTKVNAATPKPVFGLGGITAIGAGMGHGLAQGPHGALWSWGDNNMGQLGHGAPSCATHAMPVVFPESVKAGEPWMIAVGGYHTVVYRSGSTIYGFGYNEFNQLGDWSYQNRRYPVQPRKVIP